MKASMQVLTVPSCSRATLVGVLSLFVGGVAGAQTWEGCGTLHTFVGEDFGDQFGFIVRNCRDVDRDGANDIVVGAMTSDAGGVDSGRAYVYSGRTGALLHTVTGQPGENLGYVANGAGDVNADGYADFVVGGPDLSDATPGAAYVYSGKDGSTLYALVGEAAADRFGQVANGAGDVDADGWDDFIVTAPFHDSAGVDSGRVYVYSGRTGGELFRIDGQAAGDNLGSGAATLRDRDLDGHDDFILGARNAGPAAGGRAYVYTGKTGALVCTLEGEASDVSFGLYMLGYAGDLNGDDVPDFFVSDFANSSLGAQTGRTYVYDGASCSQMYMVTGKDSGELFGIGSGWAGDINRDGFDDLVFGAMLSNDGGTAAGRLALVSGVDGSSLGQFTGDLPGITLGFSVSGLGDVDGDGGPDFLMATPRFGTFRGICHVLSSRPKPPLSYCDSSPNSTGSEATVGYRRSTSVAANVFRLRVEGAVPGETGFFVAGLQPDATPFGNGTLCVGDPDRIGAPVTVLSDGSAERLLDFAPGGNAAHIQPGRDLYFQFWYRDALGGGAAVNLSDGLRVTFCP